ncbi:MAG: 5-formyltetrahydrofolate cyclo-ligase [Rikenellaceae bacterium]
MLKRQIRNTIGALNRSIGLAEQTEQTYNIFSTIEIDQKFIGANSIAIYLSLPDEVPTLNIVKRWHSMGKRIFLPRVEGENIHFVEYEPEKLAKGAFGIMEPTSDIVVDPSQIELMIVPGVAFCSDGRRLGRGKGYYDRYLSQADFTGYTIGVGYSHQLLDELPCEAHDVMLSKVVTPINIWNSTTIPEIIIEVIDTAADAAINLGCGVMELISNGITWVLSRLSIELFEPSSIDQIDIETWIEDCSRIATTRNFILTDKTGKRVGVATSQWCLIDMKARRPVDLTRAEANYTQYVQPRNLDIERPHKIPQFDSFDGTISSSSHTANSLDIDINNHVNTMRYIDMMLSMMQPEQLINFTPLRIDLHFMSESRLGDHLTINKKEYSQPDGKRVLFEITRTDNYPSVRALFHYKS